jgi:5-hydroxyisourate hydrolase-like protein (transthyretin family)
MTDNQEATGFMRLHIIDKVTGQDIPYATITVYVTDEERRDIPIMHLVTTINPARIELPIANKLGTLIRGPEYDFSTYNISVDIFGYFTNIIYNNRLFPNVTTDFVIEMIPMTQPQPIIEERLELPPHPRDVVEE